MSLIGLGGCGAVYLLNSAVMTIALKVARDGKEAEADHNSEQGTFRFLAQHAPIPFLIQCFYLSPRYTFLEYAPNDSLATFLNESQEREWKISGGQQVLAVLSLPTIEQRRRWISQLCTAATGLEAAGLAHGDIRPANILLDRDWNIRLCDLDRCVEIGQNLCAASEPFGRLLGVDEGVAAGTYGEAGPRTETFAIGSVLYSLVKGHEPFETEYWGEEHGVILSKQLQERKFPELGESWEECIIRHCWQGRYDSVQKLLEDLVKMDNAVRTSFDERTFMQQQMLCRAIVESGDLDRLDRY